MENGVEAIQIKGYEILKKVGEGGMADVYLAKQVALDRPVALKVMLSHLSQDGDFGVRFLQEAKCIANLDHPNIVPVYEVGNSDEHYFLSMALLEGGDLKQKIAEGLSEKEALQIVRHIASALGVAHDKGIVHRDIKPQNILFRPDGTPLLTDFGIAKVVGKQDQQLTQTGMMVGSPHYLSPEQALAQPVDPRSDIYSLGIVLYEMLTGSLPYNADSAVATAMQHVSAPLPELPPQFYASKGFIAKMLAKEPNDRFASVKELISCIDEVLASGSGLQHSTPANDGQTVIMPKQTALTNEAVSTPIPSPKTVIENRDIHNGDNDQSKGSNNSLLIGGVVAVVVILAGMFFYFEEQQIEHLEAETQALEQKIERLDSELHSGLSDLSSKQNKPIPSDSHTDKLSKKEEILASNKLTSTKDSFVNNEVKATADKKLEKVKEVKKLPAKSSPKPSGLSATLTKYVQSFVDVPAGSFKMGIKKAGVVDARPVHKVQLSSFRISQFPVTNQEYAQFRSSHPYSSSKSNHPVTEISWDDAVAFAKWLSTRAGKRYRLPTEAEWEYAARGKEKKAFPWGNRIGKNKANCDGCGSEWDNSSTSPVGSFSPNSLGVYDLVGNVWEWVEDCYAPNYQSASSSGKAYESPGCDRRVLRGGSWNTLAKKVHPAFRGAAPSGSKVNNVGFRLVQY